MATIIFTEWDNTKVAEDFKKPEFCPQGSVELRVTWRNPCRLEVAEYDDRMRMNRKEDSREYYVYQYQEPTVEIAGSEELIRFEDLEEARYRVFRNGVNVEDLIQSMYETIESIIAAYRNEDTEQLKTEIDMAEDLIALYFGEEEE